MVGSFGHWVDILPFNCVTAANKMKRHRAFTVCLSECYQTYRFYNMCKRYATKLRPVAYSELQWYLYIRPQEVALIHEYFFNTTETPVKVTKYLLWNAALCWCPYLIDYLADVPCVSQSCIQEYSEAAARGEMPCEYPIHGRDLFWHRKALSLHHCLNTKAYVKKWAKIESVRKGYGARMKVQQVQYTMKVLTV